MSTGIHLSDYHNIVRQWLLDNVTWLNKVEYYPETETPIDPPVAYLSIPDWSISENQPGNGQLAVDLNVELQVVYHMTSPIYQLDVRNAAMALCLLIHDNRFGMPVQPAQVTGADPDTFSPELDDYAVWIVRWVQEIEIGTDVYSDPGGVVPTDVRASWEPDIGIPNEPEYETVPGTEP